jgi:Protein of unknown function (DUF3891)
MLVTRREGGLTCVTQYDHGAAAGELAARWGNERFAPVAPRFAEALVIAAAHHDDGWRELDDLPLWNEEEGRPAHFVEVPRERTIPAYGRGVDSVYERDALAGALVGAHWTGLFSARWGLQSAGGPASNPLAQQVVAEQERRRQDVLREVWGFEGLRSEFEATAWHAYEVLQALDLISLALSLVDPGEASVAEAEPVPLTATLAPVEQPRAARVLSSVPTAPLGPHLDLVFAVTAPGTAAIGPWPFAAERIELRLPSRRLTGERLDEAQGREAFRRSPRQDLEWALIQGHG